MGVGRHYIHHPILFCRSYYCTQDAENAYHSTRQLLKNLALILVILSTYAPFPTFLFLSKTIEKLILSQMLHYINNENQLLSTQLDFHSTETTLLRLLSDIYSDTHQPELTRHVCFDVSRQHFEVRCLILTIFSYSSHHLSLHITCPVH